MSLEVVLVAVVMVLPWEGETVGGSGSSRGVIVMVVVVSVSE